jgi:hypothetical protein
MIFYVKRVYDILNKSWIEPEPSQVRLTANHYTTEPVNECLALSLLQREHCSTGLASFHLSQSYCGVMNFPDIYHRPSASGNIFRTHDPAPRIQLFNSATCVIIPPCSCCNIAYSESD